MFIFFSDPGDYLRALFLHQNGAITERLIAAPTIDGWFSKVAGEEIALFPRVAIVEAINGSVNVEAGPFVLFGARPTMRSFSSVSEASLQQNIALAPLFSMLRFNGDYLVIHSDYTENGMPKEIVPSNLLIHLQKHFTLQWESDYMMESQDFSAELSVQDFSIQRVSTMQPILQQLGNSDEMIIQTIIKAIDNKAQKDREMATNVTIENGKRCRPICFGFLVVIVIFLVLSILVLARVIHS